MANRRMIYQDFFEDDYFGTKEYGMRLLWIGLIAAAADDQGRILDNTSLIRAKVFMYDDTPNDDVDRWLSILYADNKIVRYSKDGKRLIQIVKWWDYQTPAWASHSKYPAPDGWIDRVRCHVTGPTQGGKVETVNWDCEGGFHSEQPTEQHSKQGSSFSSGIDDVKISKDKLSNPKTDLFDSCKNIYEQKKGLLVTDGKAFTQMINNFKKAGVTADDYEAAISAMDANPKYKGSKPTSYEKWAIGYAENRNADNNNGSTPSKNNATFKANDGNIYDAYGEVVGQWKK